HDQGFVEEHALCLFGANSMPLPVLVRVCFVPLKTGTCIERTFAFHYITKYISAIYTTQDGPAIRAVRRAWQPQNLIPHFRPCVLTFSDIDCLCNEKTTRRNSSRNARHADSANPGAGQTAARVRDRRVDITDLGGCAASGGGLALPRAATHASERVDRGLLGKNGGEPARALLPHDAARAVPPGPGTRQVPAGGGRGRSHIGPGIAPRAGGVSSCRCGTSAGGSSISGTVRSSPTSARKSCACTWNCGPAGCANRGWTRKPRASPRAASSGIARQWRSPVPRPGAGPPGTVWGKTCSTPCVRYARRPGSRRWWWRPWPSASV